MTENKSSALTDAEIIKAQKLCGCTPDCSWCPYYDPNKEHSRKCYDRKNNDFDDLINRQKAEIKKLQTYITNHPYRIVIGTADIYTENHEEYEKLLAKISTEAIKEFAERLKLKVDIDLCEAIECSDYLYDLPKLIDNLVKEMVGDAE